MILISACLLGSNCRYNGSNCFNTQLNDLVKNYEVKTICPEVAGNLTTPRSPAEIKGGNGKSVLNGKAIVVTKDGVDLTKHFLCGARKVLQGVETKDIDFAILKERSPSCGVNEIYNGDFDGTVEKGPGVSTAYLMSRSVKVYSEKEIAKIRENLNNLK
ncbi:2-thiouracil desulfurase family protein [Natronospora cellulosivora (SeqCode)]